MAEVGRESTRAAAVSILPNGERSDGYVSWGPPVVNVLALAALVPLAMPVALVVAIVNFAYFRSVREILFVQERIGHRGEVFRILKFRTMRAMRRGGGATWGSDEEQVRVTRFGRLLRQTHLDELPQLINVMRGDMNLIGPRPEMLAVEDWLSTRLPSFTQRRALKPGITGLAQIELGYTGRDVAAYRRKLELDLDYQARMSLCADAWILIRTVAWVLRGRGWLPRAHPRL